MCAQKNQIDKTSAELKALLDKLDKQRENMPSPNRQLSEEACKRLALQIQRLLRKQLH